MNFLSGYVSVSRAIDTQPLIVIPDMFAPPNQREAPVWCWAYYEVNTPRTVRVTSDSEDVTFGWEKDPTPTARSIDLAFSPGNPLVAFWTVGQRFQGQASSIVHITLEIL